MIQAKFSRGKSRGALCFAIISLILSLVMAKGSPVRAATGDNMIVGSTNNATSATFLNNTVNSGLVVTGHNTGGHVGISGTTDNNGGYGVYGYMNGSTGIAIRAEQRSLGNDTPVALWVQGRLELDRRSGTAFIGQGAIEVIVEFDTPTGRHGISSNSLGFAVVQPAMTGFWVTGVTMDPGSDNIKIMINSVAPVGGVNVAYMVIES